MYYGVVEVFVGVLIEVNKGEIVMLIGSNGVGKMMLMMIVCGMLCVLLGCVLFEGNDIIVMLMY